MYLNVCSFKIDFFLICCVLLKWPEFMCHINILNLYSIYTKSKMEYKDIKYLKI